MVPVEFSEQTDAVRDVFERAVEGESVSGACPTKTPANRQERAVSAALDVIRDTLAAQQRQYGPNPPKWLRQTAYLRKDGEFYYLLAMLSDTMLTTD
jgi:predicted metal-dependent hydrolase